MLGEEVRAAAASGNTAELVRLLALGDSAVLAPDSNGRTALHLAAAAGHAEVTAALILAGAQINAADSAGCTPLQVAAAEGNVEIVQQLIKHGADVNKQDNVHGNTALHEASWKGFSKTVAALTKAKANMHIKNYGGFAALHLCCQNGHNQSCRELLIAGCNPDLQNNYGDTPLHTSARYGHAGVTRILISAHCHVSDQNKNGDTALHIAAAMGRRKMTRILLEAGCDKSLRNKQHETAKDIATRKDLNEILTILNSMSNRGSKKQSSHKKREKQDSGTSSKDSASHHKEKKKHKHDHKVHFEKLPKDTSYPPSKQWSPYGCHYYPDPKAFPAPKLDTLPGEPLRKGEQYFLDLAGNICKGPVGVGYTCYCAPFFSHMEARLERDKQELKHHIDSAEKRLDRKVQNLERRTETRLSQLRLHHQHIAQWLRGESNLTRARSLDMLDEKSLLEEKLENCCLEPNNERQLNSRLDHRSLDDLCSNYYEDKNNTNVNSATIDNIGEFWRTHLARNDPPFGRYRSSERDKTKCPDLVSSITHKIKKASELSLHKSSSDPKDVVPNVVDGVSVPKSDIKERRLLPEWRRNELRKSVHEIVSRIQASQWKTTESREEGEGREVQQWREEAEGWRDAASSDSSDGEDCDHAGSWQEVKRLPYRSRSAVYSPTLDRDNNDSGYSTKICSNSQGPSPSLSARLQGDDLVPPQASFYNSVTNDPRSHPHSQHTECQNIFTGEASLV